MGDEKTPEPDPPAESFFSRLRARAGAEPPFGRALVRDIFLRALGLVALAAFLSLLSQVQLLLGEKGLLPAREFLARPRVTFLEYPTIFWLDASDRALLVAGWAGAAASLALALGLAPIPCLATIWALYLSFLSIGQHYLQFQWDTCLLEAVLFACFVAPWGLRPRESPSPRPAASFLILWLVFRLHYESGVAKLAGGDPTWLNLTAMETYYETAPIPTWVGWYFHQLPAWVHDATTFCVLGAELLLPFLVFAGHRARAVLFLVYAFMHGLILLTANYSFFSIISVVLTFFVLDDGHLAWVAARFGRKLPERGRAPPSRGKTDALVVTALLTVLLSLVPFAAVLLSFRSIQSRVGLDSRDVPLWSRMRPFHTINAYHLFVHMTGLRDEVVLEGTRDGEHWEEYELRYKPGDTLRAPPFVAPHQPRVDFRLWFVPLDGDVPRWERHDDFVELIRHLLVDPRSVEPLFARMPFGGESPRAVRVRIYRYHFTDWTTRRETGAWWTRDDIATWDPVFTADSFK